MHDWSNVSFQRSVECFLYSYEALFYPERVVAFLTSPGDNRPVGLEFPGVLLPYGSGGEVLKACDGRKGTKHLDPTPKGLLSGSCAL